MTGCNAQISSYSYTVDITLLRSWYSLGRIDKMLMAHVQLDMITMDSLVQPRLDHIKELESEIASLCAKVDVISPTLDEFSSRDRRDLVTSVDGAFGAPSTTYIILIIRNRKQDKSSSEFWWTVHMHRNDLVFCRVLLAPCSGNCPCYTATQSAEGK
ncbi:hypothetical protein IW262DRAFT_1484642 [Armillaria fumosa]|nr:hypothetical protein IW262DRAFT_1484642 [Armillaria fumosa]